MAVTTIKESLSVIVPVYNVSSYLEQCLRSIADQTFKDFELIIVDDGSTDGSGELCDDLSLLFDNVTVIHKENGGSSSARNVGVLHSRGDWLSFIDSDDVLSPVYLETLMAITRTPGVDMVSVPGGTSFTDGTTPLLGRQAHGAEVKLCQPKQYESMLMYQDVSTAFQFRIVRRELSEKMPFPEGLIFEDMATAYRHVHECRLIAQICSDNLYGYRVNDNGITRQKYNHKKCESAIKVTRTLKRDMDRWYPQLSSASSGRCFATLRAVFAQANDAHEENDANILWEELYTYAADVISDRHNPRRERLTAAMALLSRPLFAAFCSTCRKAGFMA